MDDTRYLVSLWLNADGEVIDSSLTVRHRGDTKAIHTYGQPGPFDTPAAVLAEALSDLMDRYGVQLRII
jgi:hypothetical protein